MAFNPEKHHRRSMRLHEYDYSTEGSYFVTICTHNRQCVFGEIINDKMVLNDSGRIVRAVWDDLPNHYSYLELDACVIVPNHVHGIIVMAGVGAGLKPAQIKKRHGLQEIVRAWKTFSARHINEIQNTPGLKLWQRNYYEHIIRNKIEWDHLREYIINNPAKLECDLNHPSIWEHMG